jgi:hypothetical protein
MSLYPLRQIILGEMNMTVNMKYVPNIESQMKVETTLTSKK